ncbi:MAG TPA: hypothetical protein VK897_06010 [Anaerolineales bacterium]|nr:hypothetical protein [Anaerolineales bacterium]
MFRTSKLFIALLVLVLATAAFAFAATNTMPGVTSAGEGARTISGYTVSAVDYNLNATTPSNIDSVGFTLAPAAPITSTVKIGLVTGGSFYNCTSADGTNWSCNTPGATVSASNELRVIASD